MKSPIDTVKGKIIEYNPKSGRMLIETVYPDWYLAAKREYKECLIQMVDSRPLSQKQRRACYALIKAIADYEGCGVELAKQQLKIRFLADDLQETADKLFSLSNAPMSLVCAFQDFLIRFILDFDVPTKFPLLEMASDIDSYVYACLINKKCCICGKPAQLHHVDAVGAGRNRRKIVHEGLLSLPLCADHHIEFHTIGEEDFFGKYHLDRAIPIDKAICKVYDLKIGKDEID